MTTPYSDSNKLALLHQLFNDSGSFFEKYNFPTLIRFAFRREPAAASLIRAGNKSGSPFHGSDFSTTGGTLSDASKQLVSKVLEVVKLLKLTETEKFTFLVCLNEYSACDREVDFLKCQFSTCNELTHFLLSQLNISTDPRASDLLRKLKRGKSYPEVCSSVLCHKSILMHSHSCTYIHTNNRSE